MDILITDDFDLARIAESGQCFRWHLTDDGVWRIMHGQHCLYVTSVGNGGFRLECQPEEFEAIWHDYFDLDENYQAIRARIDPKADPFLWQASEAEKGIRILRQDPWEVLVSFIISQNRNIPAIQRSVELLAEMAGRRYTDTRGQAYYGFPDAPAAARLSESDLTQCKLGYRAKYVAAAAQAVASGALDLPALQAADLRAAIESLTGLYGVGVKVASCVALFGLHQLDAFPVDVWMKRVLENEYPQGFPFDKYRPYNGVCQQYLFAHYRNRAS